jgi:ribosomal protein S18 acetylase RimI-like enzyme
MYPPYPAKEEMYVAKSHVGAAIAVFPSRREDREAIGAVARSAGVFNAEEEKTVYELFDAHLKSADSGYEWLSAFAGERLVGFACYGPTPLAQDAFDLYWICTDPGWQTRGVGRTLFAAIEADIRKRKGRLLMIWTSDAKQYQPANKFYTRMGCECTARIREYYKPGEDMVVFVKYFT